MSERPWVPHRPEQRFSIIVSRFLEAALLQPCYKTAINDADGGGRTDRQRARDHDRGQEPGQLDWDVWQGIDCSPSPDHIQMRPLARKLELKRGKNGLSENQKVTCKKLAALGAVPIVAWQLREVHAGLTKAGFRFAGNVETLLQKYEADLEAMDRTAELTLAGAVTRKPKRSRRSAPAGRQATAAWAARQRGKGLLP